jgi:hypothetical protein
VLEGGLDRAGVPYSYGFAIILLTIMVKVATFPLSKKSVSRWCCAVLRAVLGAVLRSVTNPAAD